MRAVDLTGQRFGRLVALSRRSVARLQKEGKAKRTRTFWLCRCDCGTEKEIEASNLVSGITRSCGCLHREVTSASPHLFKRETGRYERKGGDGYVYLLCPKEFAAMSLSNGYVPEHRLVMAQHVGRPLKKTEVVHHVNGNRKDNRLENLELWTTAHVPGQRVKDAVAHAVELLQLYAPHLLK